MAVLPRRRKPRFVTLHRPWPSSSSAKHLIKLVLQPANRKERFELRFSSHFFPPYLLRSCCHNHGGGRDGRNPVRQHVGLDSNSCTSAALPCLTIQQPSRTPKPLQPRTSRW